MVDGSNDKQPTSTIPHATAVVPNKPVASEWCFTGCLCSSILVSVNQRERGSRRSLPVGL